MTNWIEHNGGPQPVADDVWVDVELGVGRYLNAVRAEQLRPVNRAWPVDIVRYRILNQHLIDAARKEGLQKGLEAFDEARLAVEGDIQKLCDAARLEGIRLGLEAADKAVGAIWAHDDISGVALEDAGRAIRALDPETIAREAADKETAR